MADDGVLVSVSVERKAIGKGILHLSDLAWREREGKEREGLGVRLEKGG